MISESHNESPPSSLGNIYLSKKESVLYNFKEQNKQKRMKINEDSLRDLWDNIKCNNLHIIGVPEGEEREKGPEKVFEEIIVKNFSNMRKEIATQVRKCRESKAG